MSLWQTQSWQDMLIASGQSEEYFMIERDIVAVQKPHPNPLLTKERETSEASGRGPIFVEKRRVSLGEYGLFVIGYEGDFDENMQESLQELCREEKCLFVQVETINYKTPSVLRILTPGCPSLEQSSIHLDPSTKEAVSSPSERGIPAKQEGEQEGEHKKELNNKYYKKFIPPYTALIDLTQSEDEILAAMKPKGRYNIRLATKKGVVIQKVEKTPKNIEIFYKLMQETNTRDNFAGNTQKYYELFLHSIEGSGLFFAGHEGDILAAGIFVLTDDIAYYYYGASGNSKRNLMAPYALQWEAIEYAKKKGCKIYDFLGVAGDDEINSSLAGVTDFKMKLSPQKYLVSGSNMYVNKFIKYKIIMLLKKVMKK